jgi:hypothetical protein
MFPEIRQSIPGTGTRKTAELSGAQERVPLWKRGITEPEVSTCHVTIHSHVGRNVQKCTHTGRAHFRLLQQCLATYGL